MAFGRVLRCRCGWIPIPQSCLYIYIFIRFVCFAQSPPTSQVCNDLLSSITGDNGKIPSVGNAWCITHICEIYEMEIYVHMGQVIIHGRPDYTLVGVAAHDLLLSPFLFPLAWQTSVESISPQQFYWLWPFTLHLIARGLQGFNIISTSPQGWSWSQNMIPIAASPMLRFAVLLPL